MNPVFQEAKYIPGLWGKRKDIPPVLISEDVHERQREKERILNRLECVLGGLPPKIQANADILHSIPHSLDDDKITAYLLIPDNVPESGYYKALICGHPDFFYVCRGTNKTRPKAL